MNNIEDYVPTQKSNKLTRSRRLKESTLSLKLEAKEWAWMIGWQCPRIQRNQH